MALIRQPECRTAGRLSVLSADRELGQIQRGKRQAYDAFDSPAQPCCCRRISYRKRIQTYRKGAYRVHRRNAHKR